MMNSEINYRTMLNDFYHVRREFNPHYSLRSFAKDLDIPQSNLVNVLNGKQGLSEKSAMKIADKLKLDHSLRNQFIDMVVASGARSISKKRAAIERLKKNVEQLTPKRRQLQEDIFRLVSDWYYYATLSLLGTSNIIMSHNDLSKHLELDSNQCAKVLERLMRLRLIAKVAGIYQLTSTNLETTRDIPSLYIKKHHSQLIQKSGEALLNQAVTDREFSSLIIAVHSDDLPLIKDKMRKFMKEFDSEIENRNIKRKPNNVYVLNMHCFSLLKK